MKGLKTRKKWIGYFVMYFLLLYYIYLLAEFKKRLKISMFLWRKSCASR